MNPEFGAISNWHEDKGYGFIAQNSKRKIFFHIHDYSRNSHKEPLVGLQVSYSVSTDNNGRVCAINVTPVNGHRKRARKSAGNSNQLSTILLCALLTFALFSLYMFGLTTPIPLFWYGLLSSITFLMYAHDKSSAQANRWRTSENTLHLVSILGGWPGARLAQSFLRHKSSKESFLSTYWVTVFINLVILTFVINLGYFKGEVDVSYQEHIRFPTEYKERIQEIPRGRLIKIGAQQKRKTNSLLLAVHKNKLKKIQVSGFGKVHTILTDDLEGDKHQRFILQITPDLTILIAHNIDLAPRVSPLDVGDKIYFYGQYEWNAEGGVVHWTHRDPNKKHKDGWLERNRKKFQ